MTFDVNIAADMNILDLMKFGKLTGSDKWQIWNVFHIN